MGENMFFGVVLDPRICEIDLDNLHHEFQNQAPYMCQYGEALAEAEKARALMYAEKAAKIRIADPKVSQAKLESMIEEEDPEYIDMQYAVSRLKAFVEALKAKLRSLEKEADLWADRYFSSPKEPKPRRGGLDDHTQELTERQRTMINKNREKEDSGNEKL